MPLAQRRVFECSCHTLAMEEECGAADTRGLLCADRVARAIQQRGVEDQKPVAGTRDSSLSWCERRAQGGTE
eukprot:3764996-Prymnesium_polylepis.1